MGDRAFILSHASAHDYWLSHDMPNELVVLSQGQQDGLLREARPPFDLSCIDLPVKPPVHLFVNRQTRRAADGQLAFHSSTKTLPPRSIVRLRPGLFVVTPELSYAQLGSTLSELRLAEYACKLCASYLIEQNTRLLLSRSRPLTTPAELHDYLASTPRGYGWRRAAHALRLAFEGSASPMETKLALRLCAPMRMGGYGLPTCSLNYCIKPGGSKRVVEKQYYVADLCWPRQRLIVEYDGSAYHQDTGKDKRRINALEALGWRVLSVSKREMYDALAFDMLARQIAKMLGHRIRPKANWNSRALELQRQLNVSSHLSNIWSDQTRC